MNRAMSRFSSLLLASFLSFGAVKSQDIGWMAGGFGDDVNCVDFSPDGTYLAISGWDGVIRFYDRVTLNPFREFRNPSSAYMFDISPDGKYLAAGRYTISIWDAATGTLVRTLAGHSQRVAALSFSPDGKYLATASYDSTLKLWEVTSGDSLAALVGHRGRIVDLAFSCDGNSIVTTGADSTIRVWNVPGRNLTRTISVGKWVISAMFSPDGQHIAAGVGDSTVTLWNTATGSVWKKYGPSLNIYRVRFSPDGQYFCHGGGADSNITVREVATGSVVKVLKAGVYGLASLAYSPDGKYIMHSGRLANLWNVVTGSLESIVAGHIGQVNSVAFSTLGQYFASGGDDAQIIVRSGASGQHVRSFHLGSFKRIYSVVFSPNEKLLAAGSISSVYLWRTGTWDTVRTIPRGVNAIAFAPDGSLLATAERYAPVQLWDVATGAFVRAFSGQTGEIRSVSFSPDGKYIVAADVGISQSSLRVWEVGTGNKVKAFVFDPSQEGVSSAVFLPDGQRLAAVVGSGSIRIWRTVSWDTLLTINAKSSVMSFSADAKYLATGSDSGWVQIWDVRTGALLKICDGYRQYNWSLAFAPDGRTVLSGKSGGCVIRWNTGLVSEVLPYHNAFPGRLELSQNYPNPFNPSTTIRYGLPARSHVTLTVYNTLGQQVAKLVNGEQEAGYHEVKFDGSKLASGVYLYRMQAGSYVETRKLLLVK